MANYDHIQIERQETVSTYRGRPNPAAPKPPVRDRKRHGQKLLKEISQASKNILDSRKNIGIQTDKLMVLELSGEALSGDLLELLINKFRLFLVEETAEPMANQSKLIVQFEDQDAIGQFNAERALWEDDLPDRALLTRAQRRNLFSCIDAVRSLTPEDRLGSRLKEFIKEIPKDIGFFIVNFDVWYNNNPLEILSIERQIQIVLGTQGSQLLGGLFAISGLLLGRAKVNEFSLNALLGMDIISSIELPAEIVTQEPHELYQYDYVPIVNNTLDETAPLATVLDSGVFTGNPLLKTVVVAEEE